MNLHEQLTLILQNHKKATIGELELRTLVSGNYSFLEFVEAVRQLEAEDILAPVKSHGFTERHQITLANRWRIQRRRIQRDLVLERSRQQQHMNPRVSLTSYNNLGEARWILDKSWVEAVSRYLDNCTEDWTTMSLPELSWRMVGNEKWIEYEGGKALLERIGIWSEMKPDPMPDPVMFGRTLLPICVPNSPRWRHLIIENKAVWYRLMALANNGPYHTYLYGAGWKITAGISEFPRQLGIESLGSRSHEYHYYGDLDYEGISIWHATYSRTGAVPAIGLYRALMRKNPSPGKETQRFNRDALMAFCSFFTQEETEKLESILERGLYLPQEALSTEDYNEALKESGGYCEYNQ